MYIIDVTEKISLIDFIIITKTQSLLEFYFVNKLCIIEHIEKL